MAGSIKGIVVEIDGNTTKLQTALKGVNATIKETQTNLKDINKLLKLDPKNVELLRQKQDNLKTAIQGTEDKLKTEREALQQLKSADQTPEVVRQQEQLQRAIIEDEQKLKSLKSEMQSFGSVAKQQMIAVGAEIKAVGAKITAVGDSIRGFGTKMATYVTAPIVGIGAASVKAFDEVDAGVDTIIAKTGATGDGLDAMSRSMESIATSIPTDFATAGAAIGEVNTRFALTGDELEKLSEGFVKFAQLNGTDVSNSIDQVQKLMASYGVETQDATKVLDLLNAVGQKTGIGMDTLMGSLVANGAAMRELGFGVAESAEFMGKLEVSGIDASTVLAGLKKAMANAAKDGVNLEDAMSALQKEMMGAKDNTEAMEKAIELFGAKAGPQFAEAIRSGVISMEDLLDASESLDSNIGNLDATFEATQDATDKFKTAINGVKIAGAELGQVILNVAGPMIDGFSAKVRQATEWIRSLSDDQKQLIVTVGAVVAAIGPALIMAGSVVSTVGKIVSGMGMLTQVLAGLATPVGLVVVAIAALTAAFAALYITNEDFRNNVNEVFESVRQKVTDVLENLKTIFESFRELCSAIWAKWGDTIQSTAITIFGAVLSYISGVMTVIRGIIKTITAVIKGDWKGAWEGIKTILSGVWEVMRAIVTTFLTAIQTHITMVLSAIKAIFTTIWNAIKALVTTVLNAIKSTITNVMNAIKSTVMSVLNAIKSTFKTVWDAIKAAVTTAINAIKTTVTTVMNSTSSTVTSVMNTIKSTFTSAWDAIKSKVSSVIDGIKSTISSGLNSAKSTVTSVMNTIKSTFTSAWDAIKSKVSSVIDGIKSTISSGLNSAKSTVSSVLDGIKGKFTSVFDGIKSHVSGVVDWLKGCFNFSWSLPHIALPHFTISGKFSLDPPSVPSFGISWYKKAYDNAMLFKSPTVLPTAAGLKGFGDGSGAEIVIGENKLMSSIAQAAGTAEMTTRLDVMTQLLAEYLPEMANMKIYMDKNALVGEIAPAMNRQLGLAYRG